jgi:nucleotide-binding universal stress UspA family protein
LPPSRGAVRDRIATDRRRRQGYQEILKTAEAIQADLIVMGSHRPELSDYLLGSNTEKVVRHARCSVMVVRG